MHTPATVRKTLRGIGRMRVRPRQKATALLFEPPRLSRRLQLLRGWSLRESRGGSLQRQGHPVDEAVLKALSP
ncbi:hypothetical protein D3879_22390 [Pseudomonas cavernicola]|uniref:Uncharacterized protein n=1 Tax=Pseudomonas cavernicola TaxID=2320866 RepID=A0A418X823_9PSED|nr:hypothetical protein D3879_22390 [Pseudomonas cavernicola]